jgi:hypothetical protein
MLVTLAIGSSSQFPTPWQGPDCPPEEAMYHIKVLELMAIDLALKSYCTSARNMHIRIMSDNMTAVAGINKQGSTRSLECNAVAHKIWLWAYARGLWISAAHVPGIDNVEADLAS